uniref:ATP synthase complex subunit 8 n=1 Tax=Amphiops globus TaxID=1205654 RepID=A0A0S2MN33_9COLE|nr:ATP synthase F0 subunit 8 [Amphiops globus]
MPQMAPMNWILLFVMFCLTFMLFNSMNYFSFKYEVKTSKPSKIKTFMNWKW